MKTKFQQYDTVLCMNPKILDPYYHVPIMDWVLTVEELAVISPIKTGTFAILSTGKYLNNDPKNHEIRYSVLTKDVTPKNFLPTTVRCASGIMGWQDFVQNVYENLEELQRYCEVYNHHSRFGYDSAEELWLNNPIIRGSVNPGDSEVVWKR